ncbi:inosine/uridine-preferring nucleoside hydrolase [Neobacillus bataviensis LMG 21833]|uniref:Inosine/uridine-preferring nucleoside hydrolase n=1 Tax=Neobacillus bataviensis LMG 21833 TaxID=1117379 RepID=K6D049_9BACI|nr:nucleoside hydrolase [Neobacillus bataviensis]EKN65842.1 inosine/uridine-preferring nucleoside hydrolase [Neobacillus bataviensis LMG 21833]
MAYNVLLVADPGIDDSFAIMYALLNPQINIVGIVSGYGNTPKEQSVKNTAYLLTLGNREDIPIIAGTAGPLSGEPIQYYPEIHGKEGLGPLKPPETIKNTHVYDINKILEIVKQYKGNLVIVSVGRLTELALMFILYGNNALLDVTAFYIMGGAFLVPGNITAEAEANFYVDPIAANTVMEKAHNIYLYPLNITNKAIITPDIINFLGENSPTPFKPLIKPAFDYYYKAYQKNVPGIQGAPLHDVVPLMALTNPDLVKYIPRRVRVEEFGTAKGKSIADFRPKPDKEPAKSIDYIGMEADIPKFTTNFIEIFMRGDFGKV